MSGKVERILLRPTEAFEAIGVGRSTGYGLLASGAIPSIKIGKSVRVPAQALNAWVEERLAEQTPEEKGEGK